MFRFLRSLFAWRDHHQCGAWLYQENMITGDRRAFQIYTGYSPIDRTFIRGSDRIYPLIGASYTTDKKWGVKT